MYEYNHFPKIYFQKRKFLNILFNATGVFLISLILSGSFLKINIPVIKYFNWDTKLFISLSLATFEYPLIAKHIYM